MIMGIWRDLTVYVLLAHLVTLSKVRSEGKVLDEILAKNVSIVVIEDKAARPLDLGNLQNATYLATGYNKSFVTSNNPKVVVENELVAELEDALVTAASSGQVIVIEPPVNRGNSTKELPGPVIVVETPANESKSLVKYSPSRKNKNHKASSLNSDQDIAQSQTKHRVGPPNYADDEDLETLGDLLAITEYEPQRIDGKRIDEKISGAISGNLNSTLQLSNLPRHEVIHYDVPRQRIHPRNHHRINDDSKKVINQFSSKGPIQAVSSSLRPIDSDQRRTTSNRSEHKIKRVKPISNINEKTTTTYIDSPTGPNSSEITIPLTTKPTVARKLTYSEIVKENNLLASPSFIKTTSSFVPSLSENILSRSKNVHNLTSITNQPRKNLHSARVQTTPLPSPSTHYPFLQQQASSVNEKTSSQPTLITSAVPRASRYFDNYPSPDYVAKSNEKLQSLTNVPLGYLTRYNLPSLVPRQIPKTRLHPADSEHRLAESLKETPEEEQSDEERNSKVTSSKSSESFLPLNDSYEKTRLRFSRRRTTSKPPIIDYQKIYGNDNRESAVDYRKGHETENQQQVVSDYQNGNSRPILDHQQVNQQSIVDYQNHRRLPVVDTTPGYDSYEEEQEQSPATPKSNELRYSEATSPQTWNNIYPSQRNFVDASTTTPAYDYYEDEVTENSKLRLQNLAPTGHQRQRVTPNPYVVARQVHQSHNNPRTSQLVTPTVLLDNPTYQLHGVKTSPGHMAANAIYNSLEDYQERKPWASQAPLQRQNSFYVPSRTSTSRKIVTTTATPDPYEDSEEATSPTATTQRLQNTNYVGHHNVKPRLNLYKNKQKLEVTSVAPTRKRFTNYKYKKPINDHHLLYQTKPATQSTSRAPFDPERNSDKTYAELTTSTYAENSGSTEDESNDRSYVAAATKLRALDHPNKLEGQNPTMHTTVVPESESYEDGNEGDRLLLNRNAKLGNSKSDNYGHRVRPRVDVGEKRHFLPSYTHEALTTPGRGRDVQSNYGGRRRASIHVEEEPLQSAQKEDIEAVTYEDKKSASSGHPEDQASYQTHVKTKKHGGGGNGGGEHKHEEGGGEEHEEDHHESHGEKGDKGYKGYHEYDKGSKGYHDKEDHDKEYDEKKGEKKNHKDEGGYHKEHHRGEKGHKESEFAEKGEHEKGHSTKGQHVIHKKDEYEKKTEFYDESHEEDGDEKDGEYHLEHEHKKGGHEKKGHHDSAHHEDEYAKKGEHEKGHHYHEKKGHDGKDGKDQHHHHLEKYGKKGGHEESLKWSHKKGDDGHGKKKGS